MKYRRILLKLSGEALMGSKPYGFDPEILAMYALEIKKVVENNVQLSIVIGGGNIFRGLKGNSFGVERVQGDYMGMLATVINGLALQSALESVNVKTKLLSGIHINPVCELTSGRKAIDFMEEGHVVIISGGTGNPFFTTDTAAVLRALEIKADAILKGTRVDGVYTEDPEKNPAAEKFDNLTFDLALKNELSIMDLTAFTLCKDNQLPLLVFNMNQPDNLLKLIMGDQIGTLVTN